MTICRTLFVSFTVALLGVALSGCGSPPEQAAPPQNDQAATPPPSHPSQPDSTAQPPAAQTGVISTEKGRFTVPGKGFADGRDLEAQPPLTVMQINVWDAVPRRQRVCQVRHGDQLETLEAQKVEAEDRYYFHIRSGQCEGWLPETFVSAKKERVVGDRQ